MPAYAQVQRDGFYNLTSRNADTGTASNSYNLNQDYGRASLVSRNMVFLMGNYTGPWGISFNPFLIAQSGRPYNIITNNDLTGDNFFNNRPAYASASIAPQVTGDTWKPPLVPGYHSAVRRDAHRRRIWARGRRRWPLTCASAALSGWAQAGAEQRFRAGPGAAGMEAGGGFGGGPLAGGGGGRWNVSAGQRGTGTQIYALFSAQALNLFNDIDYGTPVGSVIPTPDTTTGLYGPGSRFGKSTGLAGQIFSSGSAARRIFSRPYFRSDGRLRPIVSPWRRGQRRGKDGARLGVMRRLPGLRRLRDRDGPLRRGQRHR